MGRQALGRALGARSHPRHGLPSRASMGTIGICHQHVEPKGTFVDHLPASSYLILRSEIEFLGTKLYQVADVTTPKAARWAAVARGRPPSGVACLRVASAAPLRCPPCRRPSTGDHDPTPDRVWTLDAAATLVTDRV